MESSAAKWFAEGDAHYEAQRWNEAGIAFERALALDPAEARAWYRLGNVREEQNRDTDAEACFERAVALEPALAEAWNNLGGARERLGHEEPAIAAYRHAIGANPGLTQPSLNLGRLFAVRGDYALAAECFSAALDHHPGDPTFLHLLAAVRGNHTATAPRDYVTDLFDGIAEQFERHLVNDLDYRVPEALAALARPILETALQEARKTGKSVRAVDLGCGTGLVGLALADTRIHITGVDLSPRMLDIAASRGVYERLEQGDLIEALRKIAAGSVYAVFSADVFIYVGDLEATFASVARVLAPGGIFAFSVEESDEPGFRLRPSGRYAHSPDYLRALATRAGLRELRLERSRIRRDGRNFAEGWLALFSKPAART